MLSKMPRLLRRLALSAQRTPVVIMRPMPPVSFKIEQQYLTVLVGGISFAV